MKNGIVMITIVQLLSFLLGCETMSGIMEPKAKVTSGGGPDIQQAQQEAYNGPKARIAVARFTDKTAKGWWTGQIGDGMAEMLATALFNTNRYIVLERQTLQDVLGEQDLGASGRVRKDTAAPIGQVEGAELLVTGAVTEFEPGSSGIGGGIGGGSHNIVGGILAGIKRSHIAIDMRVIDTRTSRIVAATSVEGTATDIAGLVGLAGGHLGGGLGGWHNQPIEKALRIAIGAGVDFVASKTPSQYYHSGSGSSTPKSTPVSTVSTYQKFSQPKTIYVKGEKANIRTDAENNSDIISTAVKGNSFTAIGKKGSWYHVQLDDGGEGYIHQNMVATTKPTPDKGSSTEEEKEKPINPM
jgi:curli biogenesis system outer membrane secretion channel CsgG